MKLIVDLSVSELRAAMRHTGARTREEAVRIAVSELNRRHRLRRLTESFGTLDELMTRDELERMRQEP